MAASELRRLTPRFLEKIWGSERLEPWYSCGSEAAPKKIGEVWLEDGAGPLPLLVKFIFTSQNLSVQVHPSDAYAAQHHRSRGKTEMWHILAAEPGARIAAGFREPVSAARLREAALSGEIEDLLEWYSAAPGDTFFIPAGTVHAIGAGLALCEIQQHSDITYRLYDYGRLENGTPRELHLEHALAVSRREPYAARRQLQPGSDELVSCEYFTVSRQRIQETGRISSAASPRIAVITQGQGTIAGHATCGGEAWLLPEGTPELEAAGDLTLLSAVA